MNTGSKTARMDQLPIENGQIGGSPHQIMRVIGIMSAKGGVGKSLVTGLLASDLAKKGYKVGILDADFMGSSIPMMFGLQGPARAGQYSFIPHQSRDGIKVISTNLLFNDEGQPIIWKEGLVGQVIKELWKEVEWGILDYLLVDMPPATSEVSIAILQSIPIQGVLVVTTPQELTTRVVLKAIKTAINMNTHVLGVVENMAHYQSSATASKEYIFGSSHSELLTTLAEAPLLAQLPLDPRIAALCDSGQIEDVKLEACSTLGDSFLNAVALLDEMKTFYTEESAGDELEYDSDDLQFSDGLIPEELDGASLDEPVDQPYSEIVMHLIRSKENMGVLEHPSAQGLFLGSCGDRMQIDLKIIAGRIIEARFMADGCGVTLACGSMITKIACAMTLDQAKEITSEDLLTTLGGLPKDHEHCAELAVMTLREAVIDAIEGHRSVVSKPVG